MPTRLRYRCYACVVVIVTAVCASISITIGISWRGVPDDVPNWQPTRADDFAVYWLLPSAAIDPILAVGSHPERARYELPFDLAWSACCWGLGAGAGVVLILRKALPRPRRGFEVRVESKKGSSVN